MSVRNWDEKLHPRDLAGKFSTGGGGRGRDRSVNVTTMGPDGRHVTTRTPMDLDTGGRGRGGARGGDDTGLDDAQLQARAVRVGDWSVYDNSVDGRAPELVEKRSDD